MNPQNLVTNLELSKRLFEEGITKGVESVFEWLPIFNGEETIWVVIEAGKLIKKLGSAEVCFGRCPALTLEELMRVLPESFKIVDLYLGTGSSPDHYYLNINKAEFGDYAASLVNRHRHSLTKVFFKKSPLEALSSLTTWLLDEGYLTKKQ